MRRSPGGSAQCSTCRRSRRDFKAAYGTAFRAPSLFDRFGVDLFGYVGNPNLLAGKRAGLGGRVHHRPRLPAMQLRRHLFQRADPEPDRRRIHAGGYRGEHRLGAHPGRRDRTHAASRRRGSPCRPATRTPTRRTPTPAAQLLRRPQNTAALDAAITPLPGLTIAPELLFTGAFQDFLRQRCGRCHRHDDLIAAWRDRQHHHHL